MIRKYRIKNFGPFKLKEELNFIAQKKSEDEKHLLLNKEILPVISFYPAVPLKTPQANKKRIT